MKEVQKESMIKKSFITFDEASDYLNISKGYLYQLTSTKRITHYKPNGKKIFFKVSDLDAYIENGLIKSNETIENEAKVW